jgi:hypothetical protein
VIRMSPGKIWILDEIMAWPERTDARVGGLRKGYAFAACLKCKFSFTWRRIGR